MTKYNMIKYTTFTVKKNKYKETSTQPDRTISVPTGKKDKEGKDIWLNVASGWVKTDEKGDQFISGKMNNVYTNKDGKIFDGFVIVPLIEFEKMEKVYEDYLIQQRNPGYPTPTEQGLSMQQMEKIFNGEVSPENKVVITPEMLDVSPSDIPF